MADKQKIADLPKIERPGERLIQYRVGGKEYLGERLFASNGVKLVYQNFKYPEYKQRYEPFELFMSIVDLLFNRGNDSLKILTQDG